MRAVLKIKVILMYGLIVLAHLWGWLRIEVQFLSIFLMMLPSGTPWVWGGDSLHNQ